MYVYNQVLLLIKYFILFSITILDLRISFRESKNCTRAKAGNLTIVYLIS